MSDSEFDLRTISMGAGLQTGALYMMAVEGVVGPMPDYAIFADTQAEPAYVYEYLDHLEKNYGHIIPIRRPTKGSLLDSVHNSLDANSKKRFASVPFWIMGSDGREAPARRQCTMEFKIEVVKTETRKILGLEKGQRAAGKYRVEEWIGISTDEASRAKPSRLKWITTRWPLLYDTPMRRHQCKEWLTDRGYPVPEKSACFMCPYRGLSEYRDMRDRHPEEFERAVAVDESLRADKPIRGMREYQYVHRSLRPLREVVDDVAADDDGQVNLFENECEGMCGV